MRHLALIAVLGLAACATDPTHGLSNAELRERASDAGPRPTIEGSRAMIEAAVKDQLKDPDSAQFEWPYWFARSSFALSRNAPDGWFTCGTVNAKNGYGGYAGKTAVMVVINNGRVTMVRLDSPPYYPLASECAESQMPVR